MNTANESFFLNAVLACSAVLKGLIIKKNIPNNKIKPTRIPEACVKTNPMIIIN